MIIFFVITLTLSTIIFYSIKDGDDEIDELQ